MAGYVRFKDAGIGKVGSIPAHWSIIRIGNIFDEIIERYEAGISEELPLLSVSEYYGIAKRLEKIADDTILVRAESLNGYKICQPGDIVSNIMLTWKGALGCSPFAGIVSPAYCVYRAKGNNNPRYFHYLFRTKAYTDVFRVNSTGIIDSRLRLYTPNFFALYAPVPTIAEQDAIVAYLDEITQRIDSVIDEAKASIEEYKAWKASIIYEAVTKGLDPNVQMKDSGVEWIGKIPSGWDVMRLKNVISLIESGVSVNAAQTPANEGGIGVLKTSSVSKYAFRPEENKEINVEELSRVSCPVKGNTIIVSRMNTPELVGACGFVEHDWPNLFLPDRLWQVHFVELVNVKYVWYYLCSNYVRSYYASLSSGTSSSMQNISQGQFENAHLVLPPYEVQKVIVGHLDKKCSTIDSLIAEKETLITDLEAYKKSLIFEVVTGKRKVV